MGRTRSQTMIKAYEKAGSRERYAMDNGNINIIYIGGNKCYRGRC